MDPTNKAAGRAAAIAATTLLPDSATSGSIVRPHTHAILSQDDKTTPQLPLRYQDLGPVDRGGFGEIRRVRDTRLDRVLVMKLLHPAASEEPSLRQRFFGEIQITAQLQHPGIVPVYDNGELADGRLWYVMKEIRGTTFQKLFKQLRPDNQPPPTAAGDAHEQAASDSTTNPAADASAGPVNGWTFRRVVDAFARVAQTIAYAHSRGIVHRDLKPANLMAGEFGEVLVLDWGLARDSRSPSSGTFVTSEPTRTPTNQPMRAPAGDADRVAASDTGSSSDLTQHGDILGTPAYMPPEQACGAASLHGPASDVYALGAILYHLLSGQRPYPGEGRWVVRQILQGPPRALRTLASDGVVLPDELVNACEAAMQRPIGRRCSAATLAANVLSWLDGARRREQARSVVDKARALEPGISALQREVQQKHAQAQQQLDGLRPFDPAERKLPGWNLQDEAKRLEVQAAVRQAEWLQTLHGALTVDPKLPEAHAALAAYHAKALLAAEREHREVDAARAEASLRAHGQAEHAALLRGEGAVTLITEPAGAEVRVERYTSQGRRLITHDEGVLGVTPLREVPLQMGSYRLVVKAPGHHEVRYPVLVERGQHWNGVAPGATRPFSIALPKRGELAEGECYVPAGWCRIGGDPQAPDSLPSRRVWVAGFVVAQFPVTTARYIDFLNALIVNGREQAAQRACSHQQLSDGSGATTASVLSRGRDGFFALAADGCATEPIVLVNWHAAQSYARWLGEEDGLNWRLLNELEREKATRGSDGRLFSWGDHSEATFACALESHSSEPKRTSVQAYPTDTSPYGVRGLSGNVRDWCINDWKLQGPATAGGHLQLDPAPADSSEFRAVRGGAWGSAIVNSRAAGRFGGRPDMRSLAVGIRVARSWPCGE